MPTILFFEICNDLTRCIGKTINPSVPCGERAALIFDRPCRPTEDRVQDDFTLTTVLGTGLGISKSTKAVRVSTSLALNYLLHNMRVTTPKSTKIGLAPQEPGRRDGLAD